MLSYYAERLADGRDQQHVLSDCRRPRCCASGPTRRPQTFRFALKSPRRITHEKRLVGAGEALGLAVQGGAASSATSWGRCCSSCRPFAKKDVAVAGRVPRRAAARARAPALEFRHESWFSTDVYDVLRGARRRAVHRRGRGPGDAARGDGALGLSAPAAAGLRRRGASPPGRERIRAQGWTRPTSSSSTRTRARAPSSPRSCIAALWEPETPTRSGAPTGSAGRLFCNAAHPRVQSPTWRAQSQAERSRSGWSRSP